MSILHMSLSLQTTTLHSIPSSSRVLSEQTHFSLIPKFSRLSLTITAFKTTTPIIRMGGGPRTYPGGVNKWQWKRMQAKKAKQLLKARLARERQIYEMRKRAELKAAVSELERPWEVVEKAPKLFSTSADEQVQVLADRFQRPGGFDLWSEKDGPQLFQTVDGVPSARFFPKGVVHSIKPYGRIGDNVEEVDEFGNSGSDLENKRGVKLGLSRSSKFKKNLSSGSDEDYAGSKKLLNGGRTGEGSKGKFGKKGNGRMIGLANSGDTDNGLDSGRIGFDQEKGVSNWVFRKDGPFSRGIRAEKLESSNSEFYDMNLQHDGSYGFKE